MLDASSARVGWFAIARIAILGYEPQNLSGASF